MITAEVEHAPSATARAASMMRRRLMSGTLDEPRRCAAALRWRL
jgi:hypothetical protein